MKKNIITVGKFAYNLEDGTKKFSQLKVDFFVHAGKEFFNLHFILPYNDDVLRFLDKINYETNIRFKYKETQYKNLKMKHPTIRYTSNIYNIIDNWENTMNRLNKYDAFKFKIKDMDKIKALLLINKL